jgi:nucleoside-diphosphate kinase
MPFRTGPSGPPLELIQPRKLFSEEIPVMQTTLAILKPDSVAAGNAGNILALLQKEGFTIRGLKMLRLSDAQAEAFYEVHSQRPFYRDLVSFMTSGPVIPVALERDDAVKHLRQVMGDTDSTKAPEGTVRNLYGTSIERNAIHGSDSPENAENEVSFFFSRAELLGSR